MAEQSPRVKLSGLWKGKTEKGITYLSGGNGSTRYAVWPNGFKDQGENQPDYVLYVEQAQKKTED